MTASKVVDPSRFKHTLARCGEATPGVPQNPCLGGGPPTKHFFADRGGPVGKIVAQLDCVSDCKSECCGLESHR